MNKSFNERTWLDWLVRVRVIIITFLLVIEAGITKLTNTAVNTRVFFVVIGFAYAAAFAHIYSLNVSRKSRLLAKAQIITDLVFAAAVIYVTGGIDTSFNFLFPLIIIIASILLSQRWAYITAGVSFILFAAILELTFFGQVKSYSVSKPDLNALQAVIFINGFAYLTIAYLAGRLSNRLRQVGVELADANFALEGLQAVHENIVNSISNGLITTDLDGDVRIMNYAAKKLLNETGEFTGHPIQQFFVDTLPDPSVVPAVKEVRARSNSGPGRLFRVNITPLTVPERGVIGYVYAFDDLTEIRRLEREVRMRDRLAAVGRLASGIAHEIRNPLSSIAGSVEVLSTVATLTPEQRALSEIVIRESERLNNIITDFLTYSRDAKIQLTPIDLRLLLEDTLTLLSNHPEQIKIVRRFDDEPAYTAADGDKLKQVFWNLCDNSLRALKEPTVANPTLTVSIEDGGAEWRVIIADNGIGMTQQQIEKLFEPFQSTFEGGTGLGLAIVYQIIRAHDAQINVSSRPGQGTEFVLTFRKCAETATRAASASADGE